MKRPTFMILCFLIVIFSQSYKIAQAESPRYNMGAVFSDSSAMAFDYLKTTMDIFHNTFDVYTDLGAAGNHFNALGMISDGTTTVEMDQCCIENTLSGSTCIQCSFQPLGDGYGGYYFLNGILTGDETEPQANWGDEPDAGFDLSGATSITFYARGETGGERVEFFVGGVGWGVDYQGNSTFPEKPYPDSFPKVRTGIITLTSQWQQYNIVLQGYDLNYVLSGFGWVAVAADNNYQNIIFYLDNIQWNKPQSEELRLLVSYETNPTQEDFDVINRNAAFSYDNALALLALLASGSEDDLNRSVILADSFVHAIHHDRFYDGVWLRNAYMAGDLVQFPGWTPNGRQNTARMPGFWNCDDDSWYEDSFQVSIHTGNVGWVIIGLLSSYQVLGNTDYLQAAQELAEWVATDFKDYRGSGGYTGGLEGWEPNPNPLLYKSTEHNLDLYVAFQRLYEITSDETWLQRATHAKNFVQAMWDDIEGKFYTGTDDDGTTINQGVIPLDPQTWSILAFRDEQDLYLRGLEYAEVHHRVGDGFDFNTDGDGIWYEGTAQMAVAYQVVGAIESAAALLTAIENVQFQNGAIPAASKDGLTTGFYMPDGLPWLYFHRAHIGASAWYLFAKLGVNPYWIGAETSVPTLIVTSPNGGENWDVGSLQTITWTSEGIEGDVMIEYSINNGEAWRTIAQSTVNDGKYYWKIPNRPSDNCLVRVSESDEDGSPSDISDAVFSIVSPVPGSITVRSPNGGETWAAGSSQEIKWNSTGDINQVTIKYSTDNGTTWKTIAKNAVNNHSYNWVVPGTVSDKCLVRVTANDSDLDPKPSDVSNAVFSIVLPPSPSIMVTAPNGGEQLAVDSRFTITWNAANTRKEVRIEYSANGGETWREITGAAENNGKYDWLIPDEPSDNCLVRISETDGQASDVSDAVFSIVSPSPGDITVTSPNGGENWEAGSAHEIKWTAAGIDHVTIEYSKDNGTTWKTIVQTTPNSGSFNWTVPDIASNECLVRITSNDVNSDPIPSDISDKVFSIVPPASPAIRVITPNGGEQLPVGSQYDITWFSRETRKAVKIEYSVNGGDPWVEIVNATENDGKYAWTVPDTPSEICLVRISETDGQPVDISDAVFSIVEPVPGEITVTSPNGGESWTVGSLQEIKWTAGGINNVTIEYSTDNGTTWKGIAQTTPNDGSFDWTIPDTVSDECLVRVSSNDGDPDPKPSDTSDRVFSILPDLAGEFRVTSPNGGEEWEVGTTQTITWTGTGEINTVMIEYSYDNGNTWNIIVSSAGNSGAYEWQVPDTVSDECLVRVIANDGDSDPRPSDVSDAVFSILRPSSPFIRVVTPNGGEQLVIGTWYGITWSGSNSRAPVKIEYSINGGETWTGITDSTLFDGDFDWLVPDEPSETCLVRISEIDGEPVDVSDAVFSIVQPQTGDLTVLTPNGGENLESGSETNITWTCSGLNNVIIEYSVNNGVTWLYIDKVPADNGSYNWTVPATPSEMCLVRISGADADENPLDVSDEVFTIFDPSQASIEVFTPNGGESLSVGEEYYITWASTGINNVFIEYSFTNGEEWIPIDTASATGGRFTWTVPDTPSNSCLIRITGKDSPGDPSDVSDSVFSITSN